MKSQIPALRDVSFSISARVGYRHIQRNVGASNSVYRVGSELCQTLILRAGHSMKAGGTAILWVSTNLPLVLTVTPVDEPQISIKVLRNVLLDMELEEWALVNYGTEDASVSIVWGTDAPSIDGPTAGSTVFSVNGQFPDEHGNVEIDTGVMTINEIEPDDQGNFNTDEGDY